MSLSLYTPTTCHNLRIRILASSLTNLTPLLKRCTLALLLISFVRAEQRGSQLAQMTSHCQIVCDIAIHSNASLLVLTVFNNYVRQEPLAHESQTPSIRPYSWGICLMPGCISRRHPMASLARFVASCVDVSQHTCTPNEVSATNPKNKIETPSNAVRARAAAQQVQGVWRQWSM